MGKGKSSIPSCKVIFKKKENTPGMGTIYLRVIFGRSTTKSLEIDIKEEDWDKKEYIKSTVPVRLRKEYLHKIQTEVQRVQEQFYKYDGVFTYEIAHQMLHGDYISKDKRIRELDFIQFGINHFDTLLMKNNISESTCEKSKLNLKKFQLFFRLTHNNRDHIFIKDLTPGLIDEYIKWRKERKPDNKDVTTVKALQPVFICVKALYEEGLIDHQTCYSIRKTQPSQGKGNYKSVPTKPTVKYLKPDEITRLLEYYKTVKRETTKEYIEMFLFSMYTGLRLSDIVTLEWSHIDMENKRICKTMVKTNIVLEEFLSDDSIKILKKWVGKNSRFVFNMYEEDFDIDNTKNLWRKDNNRGRKIRQSLNIVGEKLKLPLNPHVARHTYTVLCLENGEDLYSVSKSLGHTSIRSTERTYSDILESRKKKLAQSRNFGFSLPED